MREPVAIGPAPAQRDAAAPPAVRIRGRAWDAYLFAALALVPVVVPAGPDNVRLLMVSGQVEIGSMSETVFVIALVIRIAC